MLSLLDSEACPARCDWPYLRREVPQPLLWTVAARKRSGFINRDEASIVYNTAPFFRGRPGIRNWVLDGLVSPVTKRLGGVSLDVLDPALARSFDRGSVESSLIAAGIRGLVNLVPERSPEGVFPLAGGRKWSLIFIDARIPTLRPPLQDAEACALR